MKLKVLMGLCLLLFSISSNAADTIGSIGRIHIHHDNGKVFFWVNATTASYASCATIQGRYVIDSKTEEGKSVMSALLFAKASRQTIEVYGAGNCLLHGDTETARILAIQ